MSASAPRILCFSPYLRWAPHAQWETTILHGLRHRGADVHHVLCDGLFAECDMFWHALEPRHERSCLQCQADVAAFAHATGSPYTWLGRYLAPGEREQAFAWADSLDRAALPGAVLGEWPIGEWITGSVHSHFRRSRLDLADPDVERAFRGYLASGATACHALERLLDTTRPTALLQFNGRQSLTRVAFELARQRGIRVVCHERGARAGRLGLAVDEPTLSLGRFRQLWADWADVPLAADELADIATHLWEREVGRGVSWRTYTPPPQPLAAVRSALGLVPDRPVWALFTSSDDEVAAERDWRGPFARQSDWIVRTLAFARAHPELDLVVRIHPNTGGVRAHGANVHQLEELERILADAPATVRVVRPDDDISSYTLMELATVGLVYHSTVAIELACKGTVTVVAGANVACDPRVVDPVVDADRYEAQLERLLDLPIGFVDQSRRRYGHRLACCVFNRSSLTFPLVVQTGASSAELAYSTGEALPPGRDASLDRVLASILDGAPVSDPPGAEARARTTAAEDAWFDPHPRPARRSTPAGTPTVGVVVTAFEYGRFLPRALESVFAQDYPQQAIEVVVVDDGSTDETPSAVEPFLDRVRYLRQRNAGVVAATSRGLATLDTDAVAILCADDAWPADKLSRQLAQLFSRPELGLVYGDMAFTDSDDRVVHPSYYERFAVVPHRGRAYGKLLARNFATGSSIVFKGALTDHVFPIWVDAPWEDWWIVAGIARVAEIDYLSEPVAFYREHGENICLGADAERQARQLERELPLRRLLLSSLEPAEVTAADLLEALATYDWSIETIAARLGRDPHHVVAVDAAARDEASLGLARARAHQAEGRTEAALASLARSIALDPWPTEARMELARLAATPADDDRGEDAGWLDARAFVAIAPLAEAATDPELLAEYARRFDAGDDATLVLLAEREDPALVARLEDTLASLGLGDERAPDLLALFLPESSLAGLSARASAVVGSGRLPGPLDALPRFGSERLDDLRELADRALAAGTGR